MREIDSVNNATYKKFDEIERMMSGVQEKMKATLRALKLDKMYITKYAISSETCNEMTTFTMKVTPPNDSEYVLSNLNINLKDDSNSFIQSPEDKTTFIYTKSSLNYINTNIELIFTYGEHSNTITIDTVVFYRITDPTKAIYEIQNLTKGIVNK